MKEKIRSFAAKKPVILSVIIVALVYIAMNVGACIILVIPSLMEGNMYTIQLIADGVGTMTAIGIVVLLGYQAIFHEKVIGVIKGLFIGGFFIVMGIVSIIASLTIMDWSTVEVQSIKDICIFLFSMLMVGVAEELTFRGIISNLMIRKYGKDVRGVRISIVISGAIFGLLHIANMLVSDINILGVVIQIIMAFLMGMIFTTVYYRTRNIKVVILIHAFNNIAALFSSGIFAVGSMETTISSYSVSNLIWIIPYFITLVIVARTEKIQEMLYNQENIVKH